MHSQSESAQVCHLSPEKQVSGHIGVRSPSSDHSFESRGDVLCWFAGVGAGADEAEKLTETDADHSNWISKHKNRVVNRTNLVQSNALSNLYNTIYNQFDEFSFCTLYS